MDRGTKHGAASRDLEQALHQWRRGFEAGPANRFEVDGARLAVAVQVFTHRDIEKTPAEFLRKGEAGALSDGWPFVAAHR